MCYSLWYNAPTMLPAGSLEAEASRLPAGNVTVHYTTSCNTQSSAPGDGRDHRPKHVELTGIINKPLSLHLFGVYIIYINDARSSKYKKMMYFFRKYFQKGNQENYRNILCENKFLNNNAENKWK